MTENGTSGKKKGNCCVDMQAMMPSGVCEQMRSCCSQAEKTARMPCCCNPAEKKEAPKKAHKTN